MTPEDFTEALSDRLRREGVGFDRADLEAFAAAARRESAADPDIEMLAERFREARRAAERAQDRCRARAWTEGMSLVGAGIVFLGFAALAAIAYATGPAEVDLAMVAIIGGGGAALGLALAAAGSVRIILGSRRLAADAERFNWRDTPS